MIIDGRHMADEVILSLEKRVVALTRTPRMAIIAMSPNRVTDSYLRIKRRVAERVGVHLETIDMPDGATTDEVIEVMSLAATRTDGIVLQLPFPPSIDVERLLAALPAHKDPDALGAEATELVRKGSAKILPPVVAAIMHVAEEHGVSFGGKNCIVGNGRLVGAPLALHLRALGYEATVLTKADDLKQHTHDADVVMLGAGAGGILVPEMIKEGVAIFDAGTSEEGGKIVGDADPTCAPHTSLMTPVPGGIGPLAVALLFANLVSLAEEVS